MFTEAVSKAEAEQFSGLLGVPRVSREVLRAGTDRHRYFAVARTGSHEEGCRGLAAIR